eukprot:768792-Hanusia_phi.AAC.6
MHCHASPRLNSHGDLKLSPGRAAMSGSGTCHDSGGRRHRIRSEDSAGGRGPGPGKLSHGSHDKPPQCY